MSMTLATARRLLETPAFGDDRHIEALHLLESLAEAQDIHPNRDRLLEMAKRRHRCKPCNGTGVTTCDRCGGEGSSIKYLDDITQEDLDFLIFAEAD